MDLKAGKSKKEYMKKWIKKNAQAVNSYRRKWAKENPEKIREYQYRYWSKKAKQAEAKSKQ